MWQLKACERDLWWTSWRLLQCPVACRRSSAPPHHWERQKNAQDVKLQSGVPANEKVAQKWLFGSAWKWLKSSSKATCSLCHHDFVKEVLRFGRKISAELGQSWLESAKNRPKFDERSTTSQLKSTKWGLFISRLRWWERTPRKGEVLRRSSHSESLPDRPKSEPIFGKGMRRSTFQWEKGLFGEKRGRQFSELGGLVRISTGKAIQWRGPGDSMNRQILKTEKLLSSSPCRKSALTKKPLLSHFLSFKLCVWVLCLLAGVPHHKCRGGCERNMRERMKSLQTRRVKGRNYQQCAN